MCGDREGEPQIHARRVALERSVEELRNPGELHDVIKATPYVAAAHAQDRPVQVNVLAAGQLGMKPRAHLEQRADASARPRDAGRRLGNPRENPEEGALARSVRPDDAHDLTFLDCQRNVLQGPEFMGPGAPRALAAERRGKRLPQGHVARSLAEAVSLPDVSHLDRRLTHQITSANPRSTREKYTAPPRKTSSPTASETRASGPGGGVPVSDQRKPSIIATVGLSA